MQLLNPLSLMARQRARSSRSFTQGQVSKSLRSMRVPEYSVTASAQPRAGGPTTLTAGALHEPAPARGSGGLNCASQDTPLGLPPLPCELANRGRISAGASMAALNVDEQPMGRHLPVPPAFGSAEHGR